MQITVTIPDELAAQAEARGLSVEAHVQKLVDEAFRKSLPPRRPRTREQIAVFFEAME
jgi:post-segregation antitoxin (ccd killing protein)